MWSPWLWLFGSFLMGVAGYIMGFEIGFRRGRDRTLSQWQKSEEIRQERRRAGYE